MLRLNFVLSPDRADFRICWRCHWSALATFSLRILYFSPFLIIKRSCQLIDDEAEEVYISSSCTDGTHRASKYDSSFVVDDDLVQNTRRPLTNQENVGLPTEHQWFHQHQAVVRYYYCVYRSFKVLKLFAKLSCEIFNIWRQPQGVVIHQMGVLRFWCRFAIADGAPKNSAEGTAFEPITRPTKRWVGTASQHLDAQYLVDSSTDRRGSFVGQNPVKRR